MNTIQLNPVVLQSPWEQRPLGRECYLLTAILKNEKAELFAASVFIRKEEDTPEVEAFELKSHLKDLNDESNG